MTSTLSAFLLSFATLFVVSIGTSQAAKGSAYPPIPQERDPLQWPFDRTSIWNMPIGSKAIYVAAHLSGRPGHDPWAPMPQIDDEHIVLRPDAPLVAIFRSDAGWSGKSRCAPAGRLLAMVPIPYDYTVPDGVTNSSSVFLLPDRRTLMQVQPFARCGRGSAGTALRRFAPVDLYGDGRSGAHGGSGLSALGGSIRVGELRPDRPPRHALKINVYAREALHRCVRGHDCFRWPASTADADAVIHYGSKNPFTIPALKMGALLAIPVTRDLASLHLETEPGRLLAWTLQNYGAYIVDDTAGAGFAIAAENGPAGSLRTQFKNDWGFEIEQRVRDDTPWVRDVQRLVGALHVVDNNHPYSIGGGGTPLQPLAPQLPSFVRRMKK